MPMRAKRSSEPGGTTVWEGIALRRLRAAADPDSPPRSVALPVDWEDEAAEALAALAPGEGPVSLPRLAEAWIGRITARGRKIGVLTSVRAADEMADALRTLVATRRGAPGVATWRGEADAEARFVLNLPAFFEPEGGFDTEAYAEAVRTAVIALDILGGGKATRLRLGFADLAGLLAALHLDYESAAARDAAACVAALTRGAAEAASGELADRLGAREPVSLSWPAPPDSTAVPGLAQAARAALDAAAGAPGLRHAGLVALSPPDAVEALLGAETGGFAPAPAASRLIHDAAGRVAEVPTRAARLAGLDAARLLAPRGPGARAAMEAAVVPFLHAGAPVPVALPAAPRPAPKVVPRVGPGRGTAWKVTIAGHRVTLRTVETEHGLSEIALSLAKDGAAFRGVLDALCTSVTTGLAAGVPLDEYVRAFAYTRFGPAGAVEGDPAIARASSVLDWAFRRLALDHLGGPALPDPTEEECGPDAVGPAGQQLPLLPDLPAAGAPSARRRALKLVG